MVKFGETNKRLILRVTENVTACIMGKDRLSELKVEKLIKNVNKIKAEQDLRAVFKQHAKEFEQEGTAQRQKLIWCSRRMRDRFFRSLFQSHLL